MMETEIEEDILENDKFVAICILYMVILCVLLREHTRATSGTRAAGWPPVFYSVRMHASIGHNKDTVYRS